MKTPAICIGLPLSILAASLGCSSSKKDSEARPCGHDTLPPLQPGSNTLPVVAAALKGSNAAGSTVIQVSNTSGFGADDAIVIITMTDGSTTTCDASSAGTWELNYVASNPTNSTGVGTLELAYGLQHPYVATATQAHQVVRIPSLGDVAIDSGQMLTAPAWDGKTGGVLALPRRYDRRRDGCKPNQPRGPAR